MGGYDRYHQLILDDDDADAAYAASAEAGDEPASGARGTLKRCGGRYALDSRREIERYMERRRLLRDLSFFDLPEHDRAPHED